MLNRSCFRQCASALCCLTATDLAETLHCGLADNSVGHTIGTLLRYDLLNVDEVGFVSLDDTRAQLPFRLVLPPTNAANSPSPQWPFDH